MSFQGRFHSIPRPQLQRSIVALTSGNGFGSVNSAIRRFVTVLANEGRDISYIDDPALGASFRINTDGWYGGNANDTNSGGAAYVTFTVDNAELTTAPASITNQASILCMGFAGTGLIAGCSFTAYLRAGQTVRVQCSTSNDGTTGNNAVRMRLELLHKQGF